MSKCECKPDPTRVVSRCCNYCRLGGDGADLTKYKWDYFTKQFVRQDDKQKATDAYDKAMEIL